MRYEGESKPLLKARTKRERDLYEQAYQFGLKNSPDRLEVLALREELAKAKNLNARREAVTKAISEVARLASCVGQMFDTANSGASS